MKAVELERDDLKKSGDAQLMLSNLRIDLDAETKRNKQLEARVKDMEKHEVALLQYKVAVLAECKNTVNTCLYLF